MLKLDFQHPLIVENIKMIVTVKMEKNNESDKKKEENIINLINNGLEIAGGAVGGAIGFFAGGPAGAAALGAGGTVAAILLKNIGMEISERLLSKREKIRIGGVIALAATEIKQILESGAPLRSDHFFDMRISGHSDAEEILESVLLKSQREPEEKKLPYMAHLLASISFNEEISVNMAHQLIKMAEQLTYRQLCILELAAVKKLFNLKQSNYRAHGGFSIELRQILYEYFDLYSRAFLVFGGDVALGPTDIAPWKMSVQGLGADLYNFMKLGLIPDSELHPIADQLK